MNALEISGVSKYYDDFKVLDNISFNVKQGEFVGLLGVNGAGKTSLISSISGINKFTGVIKIMGYDIVKQVVIAKRNLGVVPQELAYDPYLTVYQTLKFQSGLFGVKNNKKWLTEIIERMYLEDKVDTCTRNLSGGMKRRLMVAQALVHKPAVIILDEPTAGVDVEIRKSLWEFITQLHTKGHTILLTTHYLEEIEKLCDKVIIINKGNIISESATKDLINKSSMLSKTVQIQTANGEFVSELEPLLLSRHENTFILRLENNDKLLFILEVLKSANITIEDVNLSRPSLEEAFINSLERVTQ